MLGEFCRPETGVPPPGAELDIQSRSPSLETDVAEEPFVFGEELALVSNSVGGSWEVGTRSGERAERTYKSFQRMRERRIARRARSC